MSIAKLATKKELAWCERLRKVLAAHPKSLWLFAGDGILHVMKYPQDWDTHRADSDSVEGDNSIASYSQEITADGGGW
jgi:hypothetical protein